MVEVFHKRLHNLLPPIQKISESYAEKGVPPFCKGETCKLAPYILRERTAALKKASRQKSRTPRSDTDLSPIGQKMMRQARKKSRRGGRGGRGRRRKSKKRSKTRRRRRLS